MHSRHESLRLGRQCLEERFQYDTLAASIRERVRYEATAIHCMLAQITTNVAQIGLRLELVRSQLGPKRFQAWLKAEFDWSQASASRFMAVARLFGDLDVADRFQDSALYSLARRRVSVAAREEAIQLARRGELITKLRADEIIAKHHPHTHPQPYAIHRLSRTIERTFNKLATDERQQLIEGLYELASKLREAERGVPQMPKL